MNTVNWLKINTSQFFSLHSLDWPGTPYVEQVGLRLSRDLFAFVSKKLEIKVCITMARKMTLFILCVNVGSTCYVICLCGGHKNTCVIWLLPSHHMSPRDHQAGQQEALHSGPFS